MRGIAIGIAVVLASWAMPVAAQKQILTLFDGACSAESNLGDGAPFVCNSALMSSYSELNNRVAIVFLEKTGSTPVIGVSGVMNVDGNMRVDGVQYEVGKLIPATGRCAFTRKGRKIRAMHCEAATGAPGSERRPTIEFTVTRENRL